MSKGASSHSSAYQKLKKKSLTIVLNLIMDQLFAFTSKVPPNGNNILFLKQTLINNGICAL